MKLNLLAFFNVFHILSRNYLVEAFPIVVVKPGQRSYDNGWLLNGRCPYLICNLFFLTLIKIATLWSVGMDLLMWSGLLFHTHLVDNYDDLIIEGDAGMDGLLSNWLVCASNATFPIKCKILNTTTHVPYWVEYSNLTFFVIINVVNFESLIKDCAEAWISMTWLHHNVVWLWCKLKGKGVLSC